MEVKSPLNQTGSPCVFKQKIHCVSQSVILWLQGWPVFVDLPPMACNHGTPASGGGDKLLN